MRHQIPRGPGRAGYRRAMGRFGRRVIDADGHGGEPLDWRRRIPDAFLPQMRAYVAAMKARYADLPGGGHQVSERNPRRAARPDDDLTFDTPMREGMSDPARRLEDMDLEGIDVSVLFPPGSGEEWAMDDPKFAAALCRTLNDARAEYASFAPDRLRPVAKLPMIEPTLAAEELERCVREHGFVGMVTATHIREKNLDHPGFDVVWETAERLGVPVCTHGGGQAPGQVPVMIERFDTRLGVHAITHPVGAMQALFHFTVDGVLERFPRLRVGFMEAGAGWLPFWLERLDEHVELMPEQAPGLSKPPSAYVLERGFVTAEPEERTIPYVLESLSPGLVCYASDYCHWDCAFPDSVRLMEERDDLDDDQRDALFHRNAARLYGLD